MHVRWHRGHMPSERPRRNLWDILVNQEFAQHIATFRGPVDFVLWLSEPTCTSNRITLTCALQTIQKAIWLFDPSNITFVTSPCRCLRENKTEKIALIAIATYQASCCGPYHQKTSSLLIIGADRKSPSSKGSGIYLVYNPKKANRGSTGLPHALLLMKISPTDAHEEKLFCAFRHMKMDLGRSGMHGFGHSAQFRDPFLTPTKSFSDGSGIESGFGYWQRQQCGGFRNSTSLQDDWLGHSCRQLGGLGHFHDLPLLRSSFCWPSKRHVFWAASIRHLMWRKFG